MEAGKKIFVVAPTIDRAREMADEKRLNGVVTRIVVGDPKTESDISMEAAELETVPEGKTYIYIVHRNNI